MKNSHSYFQNKECEYFPCHHLKGNFFNCLFCYCPLYSMGDKCGGNFKYTENGIKDCSMCVLPHCEGGYLHILSKISETSEDL